MTTADVQAILKECSLSPEQLGKRMGVSGMTIRRWMGNVSPLDKLYARALEGATYELLAEGLLSPESPVVRRIFKHSEQYPLKAAEAALGIPLGPELSDPSSPAWIDGLAQIGSGTERRLRVDNGQDEFSAFSRISREWKHRIASLRKVIASKKISTSHRLIAYGALFYLLSPVDLIPDHLPLVGLIDDFTILGVALAYCTRSNTELEQG